MVRPRAREAEKNTWKFPIIFLVNLLSKMIITRKISLLFLIFNLDRGTTDISALSHSYLLPGQMLFGGWDEEERGGSMQLMLGYRRVTVIAAGIRMCVICLASCVYFQQTSADGVRNSCQVSDSGSLSVAFVHCVFTGACENYQNCRLTHRSLYCV